MQRIGSNSLFTKEFEVPLEKGVTLVFRCGQVIVGSTFDWALRPRRFSTGKLKGLEL